MSQLNRHDFDELYINNYSKVYSFIINITQDKLLTEDIVQEAFIKAYIKLDTFRNESNLSVWINKIAYNTFIDYTRKKSSSEITVEESEINQYLNNVHKDFFKSIEQKFMSDCIIEKIQKLSANYRAPLSLDSQGYTDKEIAIILNCSIENVRVRLYRAKNKLKDVLNTNCEFYKDERNVLC